ncbi:MAG: hypothetical protein IPL78_18885 [Chloroflexi bacterium]|nr:hypothetical protein [Chloroflexota bacterium]
MARTIDYTTVDAGVCGRVESAMARGADVEITSGLLITDAWRLIWLIRPIRKMAGWMKNEDGVYNPGEPVQTQDHIRC